MDRDRGNNTLHLCVFFIFILSGIWVYRKFSTNKKIEGFTQNEPYVLKEENSVYDDFYIDKYDDLFMTEKYAEEDAMSIRFYTQPSTVDTTFLDIGCGSGFLLKILEDQKYNTFGIDKSENMIQSASKKLTNTELSKDDVLRDPMLFENNSFTHILCTHFTIYEIDEKDKFFRHCYFWLKGNGFLFIHVVDYEKYNMIVPKSELYSLANENSTTRITNTVIHFDDYIYTNNFELDGNHIIQKEKFKTNEKTRENNRTIFKESKSNIYNYAIEAGFELHADSIYEKNIDDKNQSLLIFVKPLCGKL